MGMLFSASIANAQNDNESELLKVKAAFILNLARFVEWPEDSSSQEFQDVVLCFYQDNFLKQSVETIRNKKIHNKKIKIKTIKELKISERCEIVLISVDYLAVFLQFNDLKNLQNRITITDLSSRVFYDGSLDNKVIFRLKRDFSRLRFEVNQTAAKRLGIVIGSELLKLGIPVKDKENDRSFNDREKAG